MGGTIHDPSNRGLKSSAIPRAAHVERQRPSLEFDDLEASRPNRDSVPEPELAMDSTLGTQFGGEYGGLEPSVPQGVMFLPGCPDPSPHQVEVTLGIPAAAAQTYGRRRS